MRLTIDKPARTIGTNRRSLTGQVALRNSTSAQFESSLERDFLTILDFDPTVQRLLPQPVTIEYSDASGRARSYTPDVLVEYDGHPNVLFEVKYREDLRKDWIKLRPKFKAAIRFCREHRWQFRIVTDREIRGSAMLKNAKFLRGYRKQECDAGIVEHLVRTVAMLGEATPESVLKAAYWSPEWRMRAVVCLWHLLAIGRIHTNFSQSLTMTSPIWVSTGEGFIWQQSPLLYRLRQARS